MGLTALCDEENDNSYANWDENEIDTQQNWQQYITYYHQQIGTTAVHQNKLYRKQINFCRWFIRQTQAVSAGSVLKFLH